MLPDQAVVAGPVAITAEEVEQFAHLVELLPVGGREGAGDHRHPFAADHLRENADQDGMGQLEVAGMKDASSVFELSRTHWCRN